MSNLFARFKRLIPTPPLRVGDVVAISNDLFVVQEPGGGQALVRGDASVGDRVFFRNGVIEGPAPDLPVEVIEV